MQAETIKKVEIRLTLTTGEASWLKSVMQNPLSDDEDSHDKDMRKNFFDALPSFQKLQS